MLMPHRLCDMQASAEAGMGLREPNVAGILKRLSQDEGHLQARLKNHRGCEVERVCE